MKVLFCGLECEYGKKSAGPSFEYQNFFDTLRHMPGVEAEFFGFDTHMAEAGRDGMNERLKRQVEERQYDLLFCFLFTEEIQKETIRYITEKTKTKTFNWFADDHWRFHIFSKHWAPLFTMVGTTDSEAPKKYEAHGIHNVIKTQWAVNPRLFYPKENKTGTRYDITFVGQNYSIRQKYIAALEQAGLPVVAYGTGWKGGRIPKEQAGEIWSNSAINLNFTESNYDTPKAWGKLLAKLFVKKELGNYKFDAHHFPDNLRSVLSMRRRQIKSRNFEIPACGGVLLTNNADNLADYYEPGKEIIIFEGVDDLVQKCTYYLNHPEDRTAIAQAGHTRTLRDHTYEQRFKEIFEKLGLMVY